MSEKQRGCGFRKIGGLYLVGDIAMGVCDFIPRELCVCPTCRSGIKRSRGFTWLKKDYLGEVDCMTTCIPDITPMLLEEEDLLHCPFKRSDDAPFGLLWVGESYYPTPKDFTREAATQGVSRRISQIPKDLVIGQTWILFAHTKAIYKGVEVVDGEPTLVYAPGIFHAFKPTRIEKIYAEGTVTPEEAEKCRASGITTVEVPDIARHQGREKGELETQGELL